MLATVCETNLCSVVNHKQQESTRYTANSQSSKRGCEFENEAINRQQTQRQAAASYSDRHDVLKLSRSNTNMNLSRLTIRRHATDLLI